MPVVIPERVRTVLTVEVAREIAADSDHPVFPGQVCIDEVGQPNRRFPDYPGPVLVLVHENQYVCSWGVPLGDPDPPVLVGGDVLDRVRSTVRYSANIDAFVASRRWDGRCLSREPLLHSSPGGMLVVDFRAEQRPVGTGPARTHGAAGASVFALVQ